MTTPPRALPKPTEAELAILNVLWKRGPVTVRQVHEDLLASRPTGYTTVLKLMQIMTEKGLVRRDETDRTHIYAPRLTEQKTQRQLLSDLVERAFDGSAARLVIQALSLKRSTPEELDEIKKLLAAHEGEKS